ncbi:uncharacterized protein LOC111404580 [Olea europaea var. sylvestris]|uniref:uncharacterized protein LOC111404580 n=1 Tax=Olea europaea var. sylvestris TaxID=158386 RepID=UPI000C1D19C7|nr:uncharacterized protein LOC111404580 [Olea europaea var. sylvestris]
MVNPKEQVQAIRARSGIQLLEIYVKRPERKDKEVMVKEAEKEAESEPLTNEKDERKETSIVRAPSPVKAYVSPISFPQKLQRKKLDKQFAKFVEIFKKLHINIPFVDVIAQMPSYAKFLNEILFNKKKLEEHEIVCLNEECSAILLKKLPPKLKYPGSFTIPCTIGSNYFEHSLCDLGATVNLMSLSVYWSLALGEAKSTTISLQLADRSIKRPKEIIEDDSNIPLILGIPFLATGRALIDVYDGKMILWIGNEQVIFNIFKAIKHPLTLDTCCQVDVLEELMTDTFETEHQIVLCEAEIAQSGATSAEKIECVVNLAKQPIGRRHWQYESLGDNPSPPVPSVEKAPTFELKPLPLHLRYAYLGDSTILSVITANDMTREEKNCWSSWVSLVHIVPKKGGITVEKNENNELIPTRLLTGW